MGGWDTPSPVPKGNHEPPFYLTGASSVPQQISQHQELFIQMLNEPMGEGGEGPEVGELGAVGEEGAPVNYIQVTPQEKEAIERVRLGTRALSCWPTTKTKLFSAFCAEQPP